MNLIEILTRFSTENGLLGILRKDAGKLPADDSSIVYSHRERADNPNKLEPDNSKIVVQGKLVDNVDSAWFSVFFKQPEDEVVARIEATYKKAGWEEKKGLGKMLDLEECRAYASKAGYMVGFGKKDGYNVITLIRGQKQPFTNKTYLDALAGLNSMLLLYANPVEQPAKAVPAKPVKAEPAPVAPAPVVKQTAQKAADDERHYIPLKKRIGEEGCYLAGIEVDSRVEGLKPKQISAEIARLNLKGVTARYSNRVLRLTIHHPGTLTDTDRVNYRNDAEALAGALETAAKKS
jgi:hypothetical protein